MCFSRWRSLCLCLCVRNRGLWAASGSKWLIFTKPSSGRTVSDHNRQILSLHDVTNILETDPLKTSQWFFNN